MQAHATPPAPPFPMALLRDDGSLDAAHASALTSELAVALYEHMVLARTLDDRLVALQREGAVTQHASARGEEAAVVGAVAAMHDDDWIFPSSREFAAALWRGMPLTAMAHTAFGTGGEPGAGRNAPDAPFWKAARVASVSPLVGTQIPHAVGAAWAARIRQARSAALVFFGEGATSSGDFHTGLNFAGVTRAPLVAVCRNNGWATTTPASRQTRSAGFAVKAVAYGMTGVRVDGTDVVAVLTVVREARARAVAGQGPTLVEAVIPGVDVADPVARMRRHLEVRAAWDGERERRLVAEVRADVDRALTEAAAAGTAGQAPLADAVFAERTWNLTEPRSTR